MGSEMCIRDSIGRIIRQLCEYKGVEIIEAHAMSDHIHMLVRIPPKIAISNFMEYLKWKLLIYGLLLIYLEY